MVIGGGLTGLSAAYELEQFEIPYTLIEVKPRLGGGITSVHRGGFIFDSGRMCHPIANWESFLAHLDGLNLRQAIFAADSTQVFFTEGTERLIKALAKCITAPILRRMAVSTLGQMPDGGRFLICLENGLALEASGVIVAAPARYAERILYTLSPDAAYRLLDYRYDSIARISLGYTGTAARVCEATIESWSTNVLSDANILDHQELSHSTRVPPGGIIAQIARRGDPTGIFLANPAQLVQELTTQLDWPPNPTAYHIGFWPESDPVMYRVAEHSATLAEINRLLPERVVLAGSDYIPTSVPPRLDERIQQGLMAARRLSQFL